MKLSTLSGLQESIFSLFGDPQLNHRKQNTHTHKTSIECSHFLNVKSSIFSLFPHVGPRAGWVSATGCLCSFHFSRWLPTKSGTAVEATVAKYKDMQNSLIIDACSMIIDQWFVSKSSDTSTHATWEKLAKDILGRPWPRSVKLNDGHTRIEEPLSKRVPVRHQRDSAM